MDQCVGQVFVRILFDESDELLRRNRKSVQVLAQGIALQGSQAQRARDAGFQVEVAEHFHVGVEVIVTLAGSVEGRLNDVNRNRCPFLQRETDRPLGPVLSQHDVPVRQAEYRREMLPGQAGAGLPERGVVPERLCQAVRHGLDRCLDRDTRLEDPGLERVQEIGPLVFRCGHELRGPGLP